MSVSSCEVCDETLTKQDRQNKVVRVVWQIQYTYHEATIMCVCVCACACNEKYKTFGLVKFLNMK